MMKSHFHPEYCYERLFFCSIVLNKCVKGENSDELLFNNYTPLLKEQGMSIGKLRWVGSAVFICLPIVSRIQCATRSWPLNVVEK